MKKYIVRILLVIGFLCISLSAQAAEGSSGSSGLFSNLISSGSEIFTGMKGIIFAVSGLGIIGVAIGGFFGNLNWKWLSAIIIGLMVIAGTGGILQYIAGSDATSSIAIQDSLINAG